ncbi:hypothetical protein DRO38_06330, partial [Candidatus Bathyarchaeota archaeon]
EIAEFFPFPIGKHLTKFGQMASKFFAEKFAIGKKFPLIKGGCWNYRLSWMWKSGRKSAPLLCR